MVYITLSHPPGPLYHDRYLHSSWNSVGATKVGVGNISPRAFRRRVCRSVMAPSWLLSNRAWKTAAGVCDILYTVYGFIAFFIETISKLSDTTSKTINSVLTCGRAWGFPPTNQKRSPTPQRAAQRLLRQASLSCITPGSSLGCECPLDVCC